MYLPEKIRRFHIGIKAELRKIMGNPALIPALERLHYRL